MRQAAWPIVIAALAVVIYVARQSHLRRADLAGRYGGGPSDTIDYQGERFKLSKPYRTYDDYKDDSNNLDTNELERIEKVMIEARFPSSFSSRKEFIHALIKLQFPGYGMGGTGEQTATDDGSILYLQLVEIPQREKERYLTVKESSDGRVAVLDDFVATTATNVIKGVKLKSGKLLYYDARGSLVREKVLLTK